VGPPSVTLRLVLTAIQAMLHIQLYLPAGTMRDVFTSGTYGTLSSPQPRLAPARPLLVWTSHIRQVKCFQTKITNVIWHESHIVASSDYNHVAAIPYTYTNSVIQPSWFPLA